MTLGTQIFTRRTMVWLIRHESEDMTDLVRELTFNESREALHYILKMFKLLFDIM